MNKNETAKKAASASIDFNLEELKDNGVEVHLGLDTLSIFYPVGYNEALSRFLDGMPKHLTDQEQADMNEVVYKAYASMMLARILKTVGRHSQ